MPKKLVWTSIVAAKNRKIRLCLLKHYGLEQYKLLEGYINELEFNDETNREGHAAKVYFNAPFRKELQQK